MQSVLSSNQLNDSNGWADRPDKLGDVTDWREVRLKFLIAKLWNFLSVKRLH